METKKTLTIVSGEEFKIHVNDKIERTDIFYELYEKAAKMLADIVDRKEDADIYGADRWYKTDYENNIIAFCGERGEGKSSVMVSFMKAICDRQTSTTIFDAYPVIRNTCFSEPIIIDPSLFDDVHNVLDIILATLYKKFRKQYEEKYQEISKMQREELLNQFQKVYRCISLINNQSQILDDEFDYEGSISKLSKLGESTTLRDAFKDLVEKYLKFMLGNQGANSKLLIAIDDLDLCSSHAYDMAEQIRKYLMIPNVVIVMALKIEQLQLCIKEQNFRNYKDSLKQKQQNTNIYEEVNGMAERYVTKLIPSARRIHMPDIQTMANVEIQCKDRMGKEIYKSGNSDVVSAALLNYIYDRTGMRFLLEDFGESYLTPTNLRDIVSLTDILGDMKKIDEKLTQAEKNAVYFENIQKFCVYYEKVWVPKYLESDKGIERLIRRGYVPMHANAIFELKNSEYLKDSVLLNLRKDNLLEKEYNFSNVIGQLEYLKKNTFTEVGKTYIYAFHVLYTIRMNELLRSGQYDKMIEFLDGYIWADEFSKFLPSVQNIGLNRARFEMKTVDVLNIIARKIFADNMNAWSNLSELQKYVSKIDEHDREKSKKIEVWMLVGMLSNTYEELRKGRQYTLFSKPIIFENHMFVSDLCVSLENYMVSLCNLSSLFEKINLGRLGITKEEFKKAVDRVEEYNKEKIEVFRNIISNTDLTLRFEEYCLENKNVKTGSENEYERTLKHVKKFFKNIDDFIKEAYGDDNQFLKEETLDELVLDRNNRINISELYASLIVNRIENMDILGTNLLQEFIDILENKTRIYGGIIVVSSYLVKRTAENARQNLVNLARNIQGYYRRHEDERLDEHEKQELCEFYSKILDIYVKDPEQNISDELCQEYKKIVAKHDYTRYQK